MKPVLKCRAGRWVMGLMAWVAMCLSSFGAVDEWSANSPEVEKFSQDIMGLVIDIKTATSIDRLNLVKREIEALANQMAGFLTLLSDGLTSARNDIAKVDATIMDYELILKGGSDATTVDFIKASLPILKKERIKLVEQSLGRYKIFARYRGRCVVGNMLFGIMIREADRRIAELGNNTAGGYWTGSFTPKDGEKKTTGGSFSLWIDPQSGAISGSYYQGGAPIPVNGQRDPTSGACKGTGNDPMAPAAFNGSLQRSPAGYVGTGTLTFKLSCGGTGAGTWTSK